MAYESDQKIKSVIGEFWPEITEVVQKEVAGLTRLELATFRVTGGRSNQLSYNP